MFEIAVQPDIDGLLRNLRREGTPERTYFMELFLDEEMKQAVCGRFGLLAGLSPSDSHFFLRREIAIQRFLGYETIWSGIRGFEFPRENRLASEDTAALARGAGRSWADETHGVINSWEDFERYPWPEQRHYDLSNLEWLERNLPPDMAVAGSCHSVFEQVTWLMSYEGLCYALYDRPDLVDAMFERVGSLHLEAAKILTQFECVRILFGGDDMGFKTATMVPARVLIEKSFPWHARIAAEAHDHGRPYLLHACGNLAEVMPALIEQVHIDGRHSFEDAIEPVTVAKQRWGDRIALLGGIDVDFLCRATPEQVRQRTRETLEVCLPGGGYCLGSGNSVTNYIPLDNYLAMMDEGRRFTA